VPGLRGASGAPVPSGPFPVLDAGVPGAVPGWRGALRACLEGRPVSGPGPAAAALAGALARVLLDNPALAVSFAVRVHEMDAAGLAHRRGRATIRESLDAACAAGEAARRVVAAVPPGVLAAALAEAASGPSRPPGD